MNSRQIGALGEVTAARYLRDHHYDIIAGNFHSRLGEIDIIAENKSYLCFVEVKARSENSLYSPKEAVTASKQKKIIATAQHFLQHYKTKKQPRFDIIEVFIESDKVKDVHYIENAFDAQYF